MKNHDKLPLFFLSFANHSSKPIPKLTEEEAIIYSLLNPFANQGQIQIHKESFASIKNISNYLNECENRVRLFHYGGHSNSKYLIFHKQAVKIEVFIKFLAHQKKLKLVFLNGCTNSKSVELFLDLDIPAIIVTSDSIDDQDAVEFANNFYAAVAKHNTIRSAFQNASDILEMKTEHQAKIYRDTDLRSSYNTNQCPWGLYSRTEAALEEVLIPEKKDNSKKKVKNINNINFFKSSINIKGDGHIGNNFH